MFAEQPLCLLAQCIDRASAVNDTKGLAARVCGLSRIASGVSPMTAAIAAR
jgi:hypothetical protein